MTSDDKQQQIKLLRTAKGKRPQYFSDPAFDKLLAIVVSLISEVSVVRDRLDTVELLIEKGRAHRPRRTARRLPGPRVSDHSVGTGRNDRGTINATAR